MANDEGHISTVDNRVHIKKLETEFVILGFEAICTSCLTSNLCKKARAATLRGGAGAIFEILARVYWRRFCKYIMC